MSEKLQNMLEPASNDNSLSGLLKRPEYSKRFEAVLGERAPQFASSLISIGNTMRDVEPRSIIGSAMIAAALDLPIDKNLGFAWIVPYKKDGKKLAQFQMGYKGYIQLAQRSSQYSRMNATTINEEMFKGYDQVGEPELDWAKYDPAKPVWGYFFGFQLTNGFTKKAVWTKEKLLEHARRYSQSFRSGADIWREQLDGMGTKTVISNTLRKWGPLSVQLQRALQADQAIVSDVDATPVYPEIEDGIEKPEFEHPAKKQAEPEPAKAKVQPKTEPKPEPKVEPKKAEPAPVVVESKPEPVSGEGKAEPPSITVFPSGETSPAVAETSPEHAGAEEIQQSAPAPEPIPVPDPAPAPERITTVTVPAKEMTVAQTELRDQLATYNHSFEEFVAWGKIGLPPFRKEAPSCWQDLADDKCLFYIKNIKGIDAGIRGWKAKK